MANYSSIQKEETFKAAVFRDFFNASKYAYEPNIGNIDFIVTEAKTLKDNIWKRHYLWAESKKGIADISAMLTQLVFTIKKTYEKGEHLPPPYIACFDTAKIAFVPFHDILPIFNDNDVNWNATASNHTTSDFLKTKKKIEKLSKKNIIIFDFDTDEKEIVDFINNNLVAGNITAKFQINKNNFVIIYSKWLEKVKKSIAIDWSLVKKSGIIDGDFFLADLLSKDNYTLKDKLFVILMNNQYKFDKKFDNAGFSLYKEVGFNDNQKAHKEFWDRYERPPLEEYWDYIINRRDLLVPQDIRERKGSFFTPKQWVELSQKYIADTLGENWQDEYYVWDCAAGTGNLLAGLTEKYNIFASTLDKADVDVMKDRIKHGANLLEDHVFQFDFLNDDFTKLPKGLHDIIKSEKKRKKLIIYINPPYAEATSSKTISSTDSKHKKNVAVSKIKEKYEVFLNQASKELFVQFLFRIYKELNGCYIGNFSKVKILQGNHYKEFRKHFLANLEKMFIVPSQTFDNVKGKFPIGFFIWNTQIESPFKSIKADIFDHDSTHIGQKNMFAPQSLNLKDWLRQFNIQNNPIAYLVRGSGDVQNNNVVFITLQPSESVLKASNASKISGENLIQNAIFLSVRKVIKQTWINDRDQYLFPNSKWENDDVFKSNCLTFALFDQSNIVKSIEGINHWIPYTAQEVNAKTNFESSFMNDFINGKISDTFSDDLFSEKKKTKKKALVFSNEAKSVFKAGKKLWKYYHSQPSANVNASLYDIREFFQGRDDSGKMNNKSGDDTYNDLIKELRQALSLLAEKITPKVFEYGFLME
ncbi:MAG: hypothetical protein FWG46_00455 [Treponema sp.]|nr:hypothetical protein [Treponema sp.]